ncbi:MAG TPA: TIGR04282 family arsenosugar biosynthesis glycosyltransferase [Candidatus Sulfotelmatobacter sp.]|nr:TIGR04282 family arsenosugar biosynthesis glycosyltransferase [Candidatus Sulfotelmatobacter sp.]
MPADARGLVGRCAVAVMAKAPAVGRVKTRLVPPLSLDEAAALGGCFLRDVTANIALAGRSAPIDGFVAYAPAGSEALFESVIEPGTGFVLADGSPSMPAGVDGFGRCLLHAVQGLLARGYGAVCLVNSDGPTLPTAFLVEAATALAVPGDRLVLGPADDGGYYLIGMKQAHAPVFAAIDWSTERVTSQTRDRADAIGLDTVMLRSWFDVDDVASLRLLVDALDGGGRDGSYGAPETTRWLAETDMRRRLARVAGPA